MSERHPGSKSKKLQALANELASASDAQIVRLVAIVDALPARGEADALLLSLRPRLQKLRPPRPIRLERLLFMPLDPLIVPKEAWTLGAPVVPRELLAPLARAVRQALGAQEARIEALIAGHTFDDEDVVAEVGACVWPAAARVVDGEAETEMEEAWNRVGLRGNNRASMTGALAAVLSQGTRLHNLAAEARARLPIGVSTVEVVLDAAGARGPTAWAVMFGLLLARMTQVGDLLRIATARAAKWADPNLVQATEEAVEAALARLESTEPVESDFADATVGLERAVALLEALGDRRGGRLAPGRLDAIQQQLAKSCRTRFEAVLKAELIAQLRTPPAVPDGDRVLRLEAVARELRCFEQQARQLGGARAYKALLSAAAEAVHRFGSQSGLRLTDRVRLVEILAGPEEALTLLERMSTSSGAGDH